jgi:hypothetical protein
VLTHNKNKKTKEIGEGKDKVKRKRERKRKGKEKGKGPDLAPFNHLPSSPLHSSTPQPSHITASTRAVSPRSQTLLSKSVYGKQT